MNRAERRWLRLIALGMRQWPDGRWVIGSEGFYRYIHAPILQAGASAKKALRQVRRLGGFRQLSNFDGYEVLP